MTPREITILLHYSTDYIWNEWDHDSATDSESRNCWNNLISQNMLRKRTDIDPNSRQRKYELTDRGRFYVDYIQRLPLPTEYWAIKLEEPQSV